jgi:cell division protein FtsZ
LIVIPNQKLLSIAAEKTPLLETFKKADEVLLQAVKGISDLINIRGLINLDFADIRTVMSSKGIAIMGTGSSKGENRAVEAATAAISSPLLENVKIDGATGIIINVTSGPDLSLYEVNEATTLITEAAHEDAEIIFGAVIDENMGDEVRVTVIATGFDSHDVKLVNDMAQVNQMQNFLNQQAAQFGAMNMPQMPAQFQMPAMPQMPQMPAQFQMPQMPVMPQMPQFPQVELPPISTVQSHVANFTQQQPAVPVQQAPVQQQQMQTYTHTQMPVQTAPVMETVQQTYVQTQQVTETVVVPPVPAVTPQMAQQAAQNVMTPAPQMPAQQEVATPIQPAPQATVSPRDMLLAKHRAFKESQELKARHNSPEQLSMNVDQEQQLEEARKMAREVLSSPFSSQNLEVPAFIRKKQGFDLNNG